MVQRTLLDFVRKKNTSPTCVKVDVDEESSEEVMRQSLKRTAEDMEALPPPVKKKMELDACLSSLIIDPDWRAFLHPLTSAPSFQRVCQFVEMEAASGKVILPPRELIFSAFNSTPLERVKVVLLGQDPYHNIGQAHGLCFSVRPGMRPPPSLVNMYKELSADIPGFKAPSHGYLQHWAEQGVLMLNATLTVEAHKANSHATCGWQAFTDGVIHLLSDAHKKPIVFLLWGGFARKKITLIDRKRHVVIENAHPSPLSATKWWGSRPFSKCNDALTKIGHTPIDWSLPMTV
ncbi:uracil-DNA glycosylase [Trypanosoma grayi]|uniref:uracil-DNA glycosylase n=1 Tax=Trypanosoma grayi TaxID=71804 RepID=UPI0004F49789|nr:uracil-DNA glycosylase [Trypanosoma grayi]KEG15097.1 uracil-DNA glycosylase [Trypanosoma grayi]